MVELGGRLRLALKPLQRLGIADQVVGNKLQGDTPAQADVFRLIHHPHAAAPELSEYAVVGDGFADHFTHNLTRRPC